MGFMGNTIYLCNIFFSREGSEKSRIKGYVEEVVPNYTATDFRTMFRMTPDTFQTLLHHIENVPELQPAGPGRREPISIEKQLLLTLWYVGGVDTIRKIADRFGISESTVIVCRDRIFAAILKLRHKLINWPSPQELVEEAIEFQKRNGFPGIVGAIDGTHIQIKAPHNNPQRYVNRKQFHSIQLQCVCRHNMLFSDVFTGYPGSVHDSRVLKNSDLWETGLTKCNMVYHILGDGGYPLRKWLLTPYRDNGHLSSQQRKYNHNHSSNRVVVERSFALLKSRFKRLKFIDTSTVSTAVDIIMVCCILHNLCILENDIIEEYLMQEDEDVRAGIVNILQDQTAEGILKRDNIARQLV